jgi:putative flippase GtrA
VSAASGRVGRLYDSHGEKLRYLVVGVINTAFSYVLFLVLLAVLGPAIRTLESSTVPLLAQIGHSYYLVVQWVGWVLMVPVSTTTMKYFAFRSGGSLRRQIPRAYLIYLPAQGLSSLILWFTVRVAHLSPQVGQLIAIVVTTIFSYLGHKYFTFRVPLEAAEFGEVAADDPPV